MRSTIALCSPRRTTRPIPDSAMVTFLGRALDVALSRPISASRTRSRPTAPRCAVFSPRMLRPRSFSRTASPRDALSFAACRRRSEITLETRDLGVRYERLGIGWVDTVADQLVKSVVSFHVLEKVLLPPPREHQTGQVGSTEREIRDDRRLVPVFGAENDSPPGPASVHPSLVFGHVKADTPSLEACLPVGEGAVS